MRATVLQGGPLILGDEGNVLDSPSEGQWCGDAALAGLTTMCHPLPIPVYGTHGHGGGRPLMPFIG